MDDILDQNDSCNNIQLTKCYTFFIFLTISIYLIFIKHQYEFSDVTPDQYFNINYHHHKQNMQKAFFVFLIYICISDDKLLSYSIAHHRDSIHPRFYIPQYPFTPPSTNKLNPITTDFSHSHRLKSKQFPSVTYHISWDKCTKG